MAAEQITSAVLLHRSRARANDLVLRMLAQDGRVLALYVRNGRGSQRRLAGLDAGFGISEVRYVPETGSPAGSLCSVERHTSALWLADTYAYAWYAALVEVLAHELQPGMLDAPLAAFVHALMVRPQGPTYRDFGQALVLLGHCHSDTLRIDSLLPLVRDRLGLRASYLQLALGAPRAGLEMA